MILLGVGYFVVEVSFGWFSDNSGFVVLNGGCFLMFLGVEVMVGVGICNW